MKKATRKLIEQTAKFIREHPQLGQLFIEEKLKELVELSISFEKNERVVWYADIVEKNHLLQIRNLRYALYVNRLMIMILIEKQLDIEI